MAVPSELQYTKNHEWVKVEGGVVRTGITDLQGAGIPFNVTYRFTTGDDVDTIAPSVVLVSPPDGAEDVGTNAQAQVRFSERIIGTVDDQRRRIK